MPVKSYTAVCTKNERIARDIYDIHFTKPEDLTFKAGQYVLIDVPLIENPADIQTRAFSIASAPDEPEVIFAMKMKEGGRASRFIMESLKVGDSVRMQGPFGRLILDEKPEKELLMIATSTGIAPFRSQLPGLLASGFDKQIDLIYGVRSEEDLFWLPYFEELTKKHPNFFLHTALSQPTPEWKGHVGRVQTLVPQIVKDWSLKKVYACGSPVMTMDIKKLCLEEWGVTKEDFHMEGYI